MNKLNEDFIKFSSEWVNTIEYNMNIYKYFEKQIDKYDFLKRHTDIVFSNKFGYGELAFFYLWLLVISQIPVGGKFMEIGVYKGSILSLSQIISDKFNLNITSYGVTPLSNMGDKYSVYIESDYENDISILYNLLGLSVENSFIIPGLSTDDKVKSAIIEISPYDVIYIDGGHDYDTVVSDIKLCRELIKPGGYLVMDDASALLNLGQSHTGFAGHMDVALAIRDHIDLDVNFDHLFACGHNRVWRKI